MITNAAAGWKPAQSSYTLYPEADFGYAFDHWEVNGIPFGAGVPLTVTMDEAKNVVAIFAPVFVDVSSNVNWNITWVFDPRKGFFLGTLTITNTNGVKSLLAPFWFEVASTEWHWLRTPTGLDAETSMHYLDISSAINSQLPGIGNGDLAIDPGEAVTVTGIELMGRRTPDGLLMAIPVVVFIIEFLSLILAFDSSIVPNSRFIAIGLNPTPPQPLGDNLTEIRGRREGGGSSKVLKC